MPGNLAVYFPSYQILEQFAAKTAPLIRKKTVFIEPKDSRDAGSALKEFLSLPGRNKSGVLFAVCGGKWSEGLDYRGEMLSGAMVIGLPLAPFNRPRRMMIDYFKYKFGDEGEFISDTLPAINKAEAGAWQGFTDTQRPGISCIRRDAFPGKQSLERPPGMDPG